MAKESMKAREVKREKLVAKYAAKREALKKQEIGQVYKHYLKILHRYVCTIAVS
jgi:hypothetical protein